MLESITAILLDADRAILDSNEVARDIVFYQPLGEGLLLGQEVLEQAQGALWVHLRHL